MNPETPISAVPVIAIDGPSASGKGTVCRQIAEHLGWHLLDSGALYRLTGLAALLQGIALDDEAAVYAVAISLDVEFKSAPVIASSSSSSAAASNESTARVLQPVVLLDGKDVSLDIRSEECGQAASKVAVLTSVREALLTRQRAFQRQPGLVADGRDMGSVVFPDAVVKVFITASEEERARRRRQQLIEKGISVSLADLLAELRERDQRDRSRASAPLVQASGAELIDTTNLTAKQVVSQILSLWLIKGGK